MVLFFFQIPWGRSGNRQLLGFSFFGGRWSEEVEVVVVIDNAM
jgi:hypothetical protein